MTLESDGGVDFTGTYYTAPGGMSAPLVGILSESDGACGWTVTWPKGYYPSNSATSWVANVKSNTRMMSDRSYSNFVLFYPFMG